MSHQLSTEKFDRLVSALLALVCDFKSDNKEAAVTSAFDALQLIDSLTEEEVDQHHSLLRAAAASLNSLRQKLGSPDDSSLRAVLTNNALNLQFLVIESLERKGDKKAADKDLNWAYEYAKMLARAPDIFPDKERILNRFCVGDHKGMEKRMADLKKASWRLVELHRNRQKWKDRIQANLFCARQIINAVIEKRNEARRLFEIDCRHHVVRLRDHTPDVFTAAERAIRYGEQQIQLIDAMVPADSVCNRSYRAIHLSMLVSAYVKASLAFAYVEYYEECEAFKDYKVLAQQARAYAEAVQDNNWTYYAPLVHIRPDEPITAEALHCVRVLIKFGEAAYAYARCLQAQMDIAPARKQPSSPGFTRVKKTDELLEPMIWPPVAFDDKHRPELTQAQMIELHNAAVGRDLYEGHHLGYGHRSQYQSATRLVGFYGSRGGKKHRKAKKATTAPGGQS
jgi:hypothetical protein